MNIYLPIAASFCVTFLSIPLLRRLAFRFNILDIPGGRKVHKTATPLLGGIAVYLGLMAGVLLSGRSIVILLWPLLVSATFILFIGLIEDTVGLSVHFRLFCQLVAAFVIVAHGERISFLPPGIWGDTAEVVITSIWIIGITNACNYLDGLDGLAAGSAVINLFSFSIILFASAQVILGVFTLLLMVACLGFLPHNFNQKTKLFLGDAGSTFLGFTLACISLFGNWAQDNMVKITIPILILGVPIYDMVFTTILRIKEGKVKTIVEWLEYAGKDHFHHYLVDLGLKPVNAVVLIYFVTLSLGISAIMVSNDKAIEGFLTLSQATTIFGIITVLIVVGKRRHNGWSGV